MSENRNAESVEFHCAHLGAEGVSANFTGNWKSWGMIDFSSVKPTLETIREAMTRVGLDFIPLETTDRAYNPITGVIVENPDNKHIWNPAYDKPIGLVGEGFNAMPHSVTLSGIFGEILDSGLIPARFISFERGARMLAQFAFPSSYYAAGREHKAFCTVYNALDGRWQVKAGYTLYTPVCSNTFQAALSDLTVKTKHTKNMGNRLPSIADKLDVIRTNLNTTVGQFDAWAGREASNETVNAFIAAMLPKKEESTSRAVDNRRGELTMAIGLTAGEVKSNVITYYDLLAGLTQFNAKRAEVLPNGDKVKGRTGIDSYDYVTTGPGANLAATAYNWLMTH